MPLAAPRQPVPHVMPEIQRRASSVFNPEFDFLLDCCANSSRIERAERIRDIRPLDWRRLIDLAEHHGVIPQVYRSLSVLPDVALPNSLRQSQERNARHTLWLTRELLRILKKLDSCFPRQACARETQ